MSTPTPPPAHPSNPGSNAVGDDRPQRPGPASTPEPAPAETPSGAGAEQPAGETRKPAGKKPGGQKRSLQELPETVRLLLQIWLVVLGLEIAHQVLGVIMSLMDTSALRAAVRQNLSPEQVEQAGESLLNGAAVAGVVLMGFFAIALMGVLAWMVQLVRNRSRHAPMARRMLLVFGFYFAFRILLIFMLTPGGTDVPVALYAVDGSLQILVGVGAVLALILGFRSETLKWTGELPGDGPGDSAQSTAAARRNPPNN